MALEPRSPPCTVSPRRLWRRRASPTTRSRSKQRPADSGLPSSSAEGSKHQVRVEGAELVREVDGRQQRTPLEVDPVAAAALGGLVRVRRGDARTACAPTPRRQDAASSADPLARALRRRDRARCRGRGRAGQLRLLARGREPPRALRLRRSLVAAGRAASSGTRGLQRRRARLRGSARRRGPAGRGARLLHASRGDRAKRATRTPRPRRRSDRADRHAGRAVREERDRLLGPEGLLHQLHPEAQPRGLQHPGPDGHLDGDHAPQRGRGRVHPRGRPRDRHRRLARHDRARLGGATSGRRSSSR